MSFERPLIWSVIGITIVLATLLFLRIGHSEEAAKPSAPPQLSVDYQKGWCAGWKAAVDATIARRNLWRQTLEAVASPDKWPEHVKSAMTALDAFVLVQEMTGKVQLQDGAIVDCTAQH